MIKTYSLDQIQKNGDLNADLRKKQYKLDEMAKIMEIKQPQLKQSENANLLELSSSTIQRYRKEINMLSPYRLPPSSNTNQTKQKTPSTNLDDDIKVT